MVGMCGSVHHTETYAMDPGRFAVSDRHRGHVGLCLLAHHGGAIGTVAHLAKSGDVIGMKIRGDGLDQPEIEFAQ